MFLRNYTAFIALLFLWQCASGEYIPHTAYDKVRKQIENAGRIHNTPPRVITPRGNVVPHVPYDNDADYYLPQIYDPRVDNPINHYPIVPQDNDADYYLPPDHNADNQDGAYVHPMVFD
jgi:hypothetical protein